MIEYVMQFCLQCPPGSPGSGPRPPPTRPQAPIPTPRIPSSLSPPCFTGYEGHVPCASCNGLQGLQRRNTVAADHYHADLRLSLHVHRLAPRFVLAAPESDCEALGHGGGGPGGGGGGGGGGDGEKLNGRASGFWRWQIPPKRAHYRPPPPPASPPAPSRQGEGHRDVEAKGGVGCGGRRTWSRTRLRNWS